MSDWRDDLEAIDPLLVPVSRSFPIERYAEILRSGLAAITKRRYDTVQEAEADLHVVTTMLRYYRRWHPERAPAEFGARRWQSREDGKWRWAILPERLHRPSPKRR